MTRRRLAVLVAVFVAVSTSAGAGVHDRAEGAVAPEAAPAALTGSISVTPNSGLVGGQPVEMTGTGLSPTYDGRPIGPFPTGRWVTVQCSRALPASPSLYDVFAECAVNGATKVVTIATSELPPTSLLIDATISKILGGTTDCSSVAGACVLGLFRLEQDGTVTSYRVPLSVNPAIIISNYIHRGNGIPESSEWEPSGNFRTICEFSHLSYDDPIVYPRAPGRSHLHMFFGNTAANASSTYQTLRSNGGGSCQGGPVNRSAYWAPAVIDAGGQVVVPDYMTIYYKSSTVDRDSIRAIQPNPAGLRMISGFDMAHPAATPHFEWYCEATQNKAQTIPNCPSGERVGVGLSFPSCWDGTHVDSADHRSHMAYVVRDPNSGAQSCPGSHPVMVPQLSIGIWFTHDGNSKNWHLSSDRMPGMTHANGSTFHSDWFGAWEPSVQQTWTSQCVVGMRNCIDGELGDGIQLNSAQQYLGPRSLPPPPRP